MTSLFDDISRTIASPIPRRQAFRLIGGALGGAVVTALGLGWASRAWGAPGGGQSVPADSSACRKGQTLCGSGRPAVCCSSGQACCGSATVGYTCCFSGQGCCTDTSKPYCMPAKSTCCKGASCSSTQTCCNGKCCNNGAHQTCCGAPGSPVCCSAGRTCCKGRCCTEGPSPSNPCQGARCS